MLKLLKKPTSEQIAEKMLKAVVLFDDKLKGKPSLSQAEQRHRARLQTSAVLSPSQIIRKKK